MLSGNTTSSANIRQTPDRLRKAYFVQAVSFDARSKTMTVKKAQGKVTYAKVSKGSSKYLTISKSTGKITVKKKTPKGTYEIKVKVTAAGNSNYKKGSKTVTVKVKVK